MRLPPRDGGSTTQQRKIVYTGCSHFLSFLQKRQNINNASIVQNPFRKHDFLYHGAWQTWQAKWLSWHSGIRSVMSRVAGGQASRQPSYATSCWAWRVTFHPPSRTTDLLLPLLLFHPNAGSRRRYRNLETDVVRAEEEGLSGGRHMKGDRVN